MQGPVNDYLRLAKYYDDAYAAMKDLADVPFYLDLAKERGGPVLEIGCGTGRVLLPIARSGIEIHGVDNSEPMLSVLREHLASETPEVRERVTLHEGDMRTLHVEREFPLVIIPFRPMQHLFTIEDQLNALKAAADHLTADGILAFDVFFPNFERIAGRIGEEVFEVEWPISSEPGTVMRRFFRKKWVDRVGQSFGLDFIFRTFRDGAIVREEVEPFRMSFYTYPHLRALFLLAGLKAVAEYGSFDRAPLDNQSKDMIFLLRRA